MSYKHFTLEKRKRLAQLLKLGYHKSRIAEEFNCSLHTIYNEINRGTVEQNEFGTSAVYDPMVAQERYEKFLKEKGSVPKVMQSKKVIDLIRKMIKEEHCSPETVLRRLQESDINLGVEIKSVQTIYSAIRNGYIEGVNLSDLPRRGFDRTETMPINIKIEKNIYNELKEYCEKNNQLMPITIESAILAYIKCKE